MQRRHLTPSLVAALVGGGLLAIVPSLARAQMAPGGGFGAPGGGMQPPPQGQQEKEEGPAEEAPEENRPADLEPLTGYAEQSKHKMQLFQLDGYMRVRSDYMHDFFLGQGYSNVQGPPNSGMNFGLPPFPVPLECPAPGGANNVAVGTPGTPDAPASNCSHKNIGGANMRLRLEPTINVTDQVRVHTQIDVFDNTIMGSTPSSLVGIQGYNRSTNVNSGGTMNTLMTSMYPSGANPNGFLATSVDPPEVGQNGFLSSVRAKRAWAEVDGEFGSLRFGRMPWHWGRGIFYNDGSCADCDVGTTVDRVMALTTVYGHQIAAAWDLGAQGITTQQLTLGRDDPSGYPYDLSQNDDVLELMASITKIDNQVDLRERIDRGDMVVNYGLQLVYRNQGNTVIPQNPPVNTQNTTGPQPQSPSQLPRATYFGALSVTPDVWFKLYYKALTIEAEGIGIFGRINKPGDLAVDQQELVLRQFGWVVAGELRLYRDSLFVGLETGGASGDQAEDASQYLNYAWKFVQQPSGDHTLADFHFSPDYHVDEIFFRHIYGTVTNAIYVKPQVAYWFDLGRTRAIGISGNVLYSVAQVPVSTPGNALNYGVETDLNLGYRNTGEGFYAGATWGVFFPLSALDRGAFWGSDAASASTAQILRVHFGVKF
jgi:uncharacterized protein (TIGR04551 family)